MGRHNIYQPVPDFVEKIALLGLSAQEFYQGAGIGASTYYAVLKSRAALPKTAVTMAKYYGTLKGIDTASALAELFLSPQQQALHLLHSSQ